MVVSYDTISYHTISYDTIRYIHTFIREKKNPPCNSFSIPTIITKSPLMSRRLIQASVVCEFRKWHEVGLE